MKSHTYLIAIPTEIPGGLTALQSPHFAYYQVYSLITLKNNTVCNIQIIPNNSHSKSINTHETIDRLISLKIHILITRGIGLYPLASLQKAGICVLFSKNLTTVTDIMSAFIKKSLSIFPTSPYS